MEWFKQHADTLVILSSFALCFWNINEKMNDRFNVLNEKIGNIDKDLAVIKTVLVIKNIMPNELANHESKEIK